MMTDTYFPDNYWCNLYGCWCDIVHWAMGNPCNGICDECEFGEERDEEVCVSEYKKKAIMSRKVKAILELEMPKSCWDCPCIQDRSETWRWCGAIGGDCPNSPYEKRRDDCPLKPVEEGGGTMNINKICPLLFKTAIDSKSQTYALCLQEKCGFWDNYNEACGIASIAWFQAQTAEAVDKK